MFKEYENLLPNNIVEELKNELSQIRVTNEQVKLILEATRKEYENANINPGEAIGVITAESFGEPGTQMSVSKNEKIIVKSNGKIKIVKIGKFVDFLMKKYGSLKIYNSQITPINNLDVYVPSLDQNEKIKWKKIIECSKHKTNKNLLKLTTKSGRKITATDNHSFVIRKENRIIPTIGRELEIGDRIPVLKYLPEHCIKEINLVDYLDIPKDSRFPIIEEDNCLVKEHTNSKSIPNKLKLDYLFGWFIGAYLAEGNATHGQISISNIDDDFINNLKTFTTRIGLKYTEEYHQRGFSLSRDFKINSALLANFIRNVCKTGSNNKVVPDFSYSAKEEFVSGLLRGYFDGDGNYHIARKMIRASSNSEELIRGIALLLTRFKIFSYITKDKKGQYWILIPYKYAPLFLEKIGSSIKEKREALNRLNELAKNFWNDTSQDYNDMISGFGTLFYDAAKKVGIPTRYLNSFTKRQKIGRTALFRYMKKFEKLAKEKNVDIKRELQIMNQMFYSDVVWDEIVNIESVSNNDYVYDLSVPGLETFTTFDGIITHNTLNVFHFAGVAEVSVTLGLPRLIEIFDARKVPSKPIMEVYLNKEYNKDAEKVRSIAVSIKETKFEEISLEYSINLVNFYVEVKIDKKKMKEIGLRLDVLIKKLSESLKNVAIKQKDDSLIFKLKEKEHKINDVYKLKEKLKDCYISGIKGITQVLPKKKGNEFFVLCAGSNLKDVLKIEGVDETRTVSNNIFEIKSILGIEAARRAIINEAQNVINEQGLDIDVRHIMLVADLMTTDGNVRGITRSGITGEKESVLARASFETPLRHLVNASLVGEIDKLNSVVENVMLNQSVPVGTGLPGLVTKMKKENAKEK